MINAICIASISGVFKDLEMAGVHLAEVWIQMPDKGKELFQHTWVDPEVTLLLTKQLHVPFKFIGFQCLPNL
jgi:hypothetical protein